MNYLRLTVALVFVGWMLSIEYRLLLNLRIHERNAELKMRVPRDKVSPINRETEKASTS